MKKAALLFLAITLTVSVIYAQDTDWCVDDAYSIASDMVRYIPTTGAALVNWQTNNPRLTQYDAYGTMEWEQATNSYYGGYASVSDDGTLAICSDNTKIRLLDALTGTTQRTVDVGSYVCALAMRHDGTGYFVGCGAAASYRIHYYPTDADQPAWEIEGLPRPVLDFSLPADDSRLIATFNAYLMAMWAIDPTQGEVLQDDIPYFNNTPNQAPALNADGTYLAYTDFNGKAYLYRWDGGRYVKQWEANLLVAGYPSCWGNAQAISADGSLIAIGTNDFSDTVYDGSFYLFSSSSPTPLWSLHHLGDAVVQAAISDDGQTIGCVTWGPRDHHSGDFYLFKPDSSQPLFELNTRGSLMTIDMSHDGSHCLVGGKQVHARDQGNGGWAYLIAYDPTGTAELMTPIEMTATCQADNTLTLHSELNLEGTLELFDMNGRMIQHTDHVSTNTAIATRNLAKGLYIAQFHTREKTHTIRLINK